MASSSVQGESSSVMSCDEIIESAAGGQRLSREDALELFAGGNLSALGLAADRVCSRLHPGDIRTYVIDRNINYTNVCVSGCRFCAFYRSPDSPEAYVLTRDQVLAKVEEAVGLGATQILMQGGLHPDLPLSYYTDLLRAVKAGFAVHLHCFSPPEIVHISRVSGLSVQETLVRLRDAGLDSLPGGGAEILSDRVRRRVSPNKCSVDQWIAVMRAVAQLGMRATATMMLGHVESADDRVEHLLRVRDLQDETSVFTAFIPWTYQPGNTALGGKSAGAYEYLKTLAISRLVLDNVPNAQASWVTQGLPIAQVALRLGANDIGSTMIEENVVAATGLRFGASVQDLELNIRAAGFVPAQRDTMYGILRVPDAEARVSA